MGDLNVNVGKDTVDGLTGKYALGDKNELRKMCPILSGISGKQIYNATKNKPWRNG